MPQLSGDWLHEVKPNPFNPRASFEFSIERSEHVLLSVFSLSGRWVRTLADQIYNTGKHVLIWDGNDAEGFAMPSGIYLIRFRTGNTIQTRKAILAR